MHHCTSIVGEEVGSVATASEAIVDEASGGARSVFMLACDDTALDVTDEASGAIASDTCVTISGVVAKGCFMSSVTKASSIAVGVVLDICERWVAAAYQLIGVVVAIRSGLAVDCHAGAVAVFTCIIPSWQATASVLGAKTVAIGIAADSGTC